MIGTSKRYVTFDLTLALQVGGVLCYTPEDGISLDLLRKDVEFLRRRYELDQHGKSEGRLVIKQVFVFMMTGNNN